METYFRNGALARGNLWVYMGCTSPWLRVKWSSTPGARRTFFANEYIAFIVNVSKDFVELPSAGGDPIKNHVCWRYIRITMEWIRIRSKLKFRNTTYAFQEIFRELADIKISGGDVVRSIIVRLRSDNISNTQQSVAQGSVLDARPFLFRSL